ncbi:penicillin-binding protein 1C [Oscillatoria sp. FACHB-1407]|uniref:penicillin-binding protein 1C n=1 Tax=Oscillatoria sp. FACHB-1407 TaxID=2692847 RepID=UPI001689660C|nr:penicillin-binding protein 1C [Oscillatoria sp. FACHB-1407]MBD2460138.1 penicillin-binding protein 1C [Oscillatoria sp. FACHB-1407]
MNWNWGHRIWRKLNRWQRGGVRLLLVVLLLGLMVRSLPYLAPIPATDIAQDDQAVTFRDRHGALLGTLLTRDQEHTAVVPLEQVSPHFLHAIIAAEDKRFYQHGAVDLWAVGRAIAEAIQARHIVSGASTITMQLARMLEPTPVTLWGKAQEIWLAWRLAAGMSKDEILQAYVNRLPMGGNVYGVEAASRVYFGVPARDLTIAQASLLAGLPNDPNNLNPYTRLIPLQRRQGYVLARMVEDGYITQAQADRATTGGIAVRSREQGIVAAPHYLFWLADQLPPDHLPDIRTTIDLPLQQFVEAQVKQVIQSLATNNVHQAAAIVLDNHSGEVLAYVGSTDYFSDAQMGRNDGVQALRQPGSTLKPFLYELALEKRTIRPNTILADVPTYYAIPGAKLYSPTDYSETFQGPVRVRVALANSLNVPAVRVLEKVGVPSFLERLHELGFRHLTETPEHYGLGLTLGSGEVNLWELAQAYRMMACQGGRGTINRVCTKTGESLSRYTEHAEATWALITDMLSDRHARARSFGVDSVLSLPFPVAVKTGTSSDFRDTWTVGFTTDYTVATWVGNFDGSPMHQVSGVTGAAPLWSRILLHLHEQQEPSAFLPPSGLVQRPICAISGARPTPACPTVVQEYLYPEDLYAYEHEPDPFYGAVATGNSSSQLRLPPEYNEWLATQQQPTLNPDQLRILTPRNGDYFLAANASSESNSRLEFKVTGRQNQPVEWWLNGEKLATQSADSLFWALRPGDWRLQVKSGEMTDQVMFEVRVAEPSNNPQRGFSVVGQ